jgi:hypothetical protein
VAVVCKQREGAKLPMMKASARPVGESVPAGELGTTAERSNMAKPPREPRENKKPWVFKSREGKGSHLLTSTESRDKDGKKVITFKRSGSGNSNN